jgi:hypothetical protein
MDSLAQDRDHRLAPVETVMPARFPLKSEEYFDYHSNYFRYKKDSARWIY